MEQNNDLSVEDCSDNNYNGNPDGHQANASEKSPKIGIEHIDVIDGAHEPRIVKSSLTDFEEGKFEVIFNFNVILNFIYYILEPEENILTIIKAFFAQQTEGWLPVPHCKIYKSNEGQFFVMDSDNNLKPISSTTKTKPGNYL